MEISAPDETIAADRRSALPCKTGFVWAWLLLTLSLKPLFAACRLIPYHATKMILEFRMPVISPHSKDALIECLYVVPGAPVKMGDALLDLSINLSHNFSQDCPPISFYRIVVREKAILREVRFERGQSCRVGDVIAVFSTEPDELLGPPAARGIRVATAAIVYHSGLWTGNAA
jgi:hypothetical protein